MKFFFDYVAPSTDNKRPVRVCCVGGRGVSVPISAIVLVVIAVACGLILIIVNVKVTVFKEKFLRGCLRKVLPIFCLKLVLGVFYIAFVAVLMFRPLLTGTVLVGNVGLLRQFRLVEGGRKQLGGLRTSVSACQGATTCLGGGPLIVIGMVRVAFVRHVTLFTMA